MVDIFHQGRASPPILLLHGGAGSLPDPGAQARRQEALSAAGKEVLARLVQDLSAASAVALAVEKLEDCSLFNAGRGAALQSDGLARLSASLMDGARQKFSGVLLATHLFHPSRLAAYLQNQEESVVGPLGVQLIARQLGIPPELPDFKESLERWAKASAYRERLTRTSTVGAVALDLHGNLAAATSTGGVSANFPERVSDSATVAGNYASSHAAISCTGIGEQIVDDGLAVRLETRVRDGASLISASHRTLKEAKANRRRYGWIGVDRAGNWVVACTTEAIAWWASQMETSIRIKRAYDPPAAEDGARFLVDRVWPGGVRKEQLSLSGWCREAAPSAALRKWFDHDPQKWETFKQRYFAELKARPKSLQTILAALEQGPITLVYGAADPIHNTAAALKEFLLAKLQGKE